MTHLLTILSRLLVTHDRVSLARPDRRLFSKMVIKRKVRAKRAVEIGADWPEQKTRTRPWWQLANHTVEIFSAYYNLSERTLHRMKSQGVDLRDVRAVFSYQQESARAARGPIKHALLKWNEWQGQRNRNREAVLSRGGQAENTVGWIEGKKTRPEDVASNEQIEVEGFPQALSGDSQCSSAPEP